ncbi:DUF2339 domain-containing protein [Sphingobacterium alkalisoli]|uniref:DUF2339 domain-containing protein n=1 Tax=Sphingobacterium alkalisoli TaxID=1874115 RepID=A0A4U0H2C9_9SPHI|nr:DUF2339 domain-containing protein [Sphingobacterium alkalisoli]TJY65773.1 DUF2339 domain-containing protein [Sphingobacterium alkalisoli]GGH18407.1 membrane protein [Sphingobacterium alkalisoli]
MTENSQKINQLFDKLDLLLKRQNDFSREINDLRIELSKLKAAEQKTAPETGFDAAKENTVPVLKSDQHQRWRLPKQKSDIEKFIGENLINKVGIAITIIGVAIGAKYSIENDLISPLTRIILGYLFGFVLLGLGIKLKRNYENYSAVLVSGAMAIMYFITYFAYGLYHLIPQFTAFALMVVFTVFTVIAALNYKRQIIAHVGLVGAYAVPFLLSNSSGNVAVLFSYMTILNMGILTIAVKKYWKPLHYTSFALTWFIYFSWYVSNYQTIEHFGLALIFLSIFFVLFYMTFLAYKLLHKEKYVVDDIILLIVNSFVYYGIGYTILEKHPTGEQLLGVFTICNAVAHFIVSVIIYRQKLADRNLFYLILGLVLIFITIAVPVQLSGNWVTLLWAGEAALLFWIGRTSNATFYEKISYPLILLAFFSLLHDWKSVYDTYDPEDPTTRITPILNVNFLTSILSIAAFGFINMLRINKKYAAGSAPKTVISTIIFYAIPTIFLFTTYYAFRMEIANYWNQLYKDAVFVIHSGNQQYINYSSSTYLKQFKTIWIINYSLLFVSVLSITNYKFFKNRQLGLINFVLIILAVGVFLTYGLYVLSELRESVAHVGVRYVSFALVALALFSCYRYTCRDFTERDFKMKFDFLLHTSILWIASSELINWMDMSESTHSYKLGLSILWGSYSLVLIAFGIWKKNKPLRIGAMVLFGSTLLKLFLYDISHLNTISKTIVFVSLGVLLLIISFLYHKYKNLIAPDTIGEIES